MRWVLNVIKKEILMLKYHILLGQPSQTSNADFTHYLTLGSHHTNVDL